MSAAVIIALIVGGLVLTLALPGAVGTLVIAAIVLSLVILVLLLGFLLGLFVYRESLLNSEAFPAPPRQSVDCSVPDVTPPPLSDPGRTLQGNETGTIVDSTIDLPANVSFNFPPGNLTLIARGDLNIDGKIPFAVGGGDTLTLISLSGTVRIGPTAIIGPRPPVGTKVVMDEFRRGPYAGGFVKIVAPAVEIEGLIFAEPGTAGAAATANGVGAGPLGGTGVALGGRGGFGGTILICAQESIDIIDFAQIRGGDGGNGGSATATARNASDALAAGGPGNDGGDVVFRGTGPGPCTVTFRGAGGFVPKVSDGDGGDGAMGTASGGTGTRANAPVLNLFVGYSGGDGTAIGGGGGAGGR